MKKRAWVWILVTALIIPGLITFAVLRGQAKSDPYEDMLREGAVERGINPEKLVRLNRLEVAIAADKADRGQWAEFEKILQDPNREIRDTAYSVLTRARKTSRKNDAVQLIEQMKNDPDPGIRSRYGWQLMLVGAPHWRTVCEQEKSSSDPETRRLAEQALKQGARLGR